MDRLELLATLADRGVQVSIDGSPPVTMAGGDPARFADPEHHVRVMDMTTLPGSLREHLEEDGSLPTKKPRAARRGRDSDT